MLSPIITNTIQVSPPTPFTDVNMALTMNNPAKSELITFLGKWDFSLVPWAALGCILRGNPEP